MIQDKLDGDGDLGDEMLFVCNGEPEGDKNQADEVCFFVFIFNVLVFVVFHCFQFFFFSASIYMFKE